MKNGTAKKGGFDEDIGSADKIIGNYADMIGRKKKEVEETLVASMKLDISPYEKSVMFVLGAKEGLMLARSAHEQGTVIDPDILGRISLAHAVLTKIQKELSQ